MERLRILVVGDDYLPSTVWKAGFADIEAQHDVRYVQIDGMDPRPPRSPADHRIDEYLGGPEHVIEALSDDDVLVVHGAAVTEDVLDKAPQLRLLACARGGPVNIDTDAAAARGLPIVLSPGKNALAVAELAIGFMLVLARRIPESVQALTDGRATGLSTYEGAGYFGRELSSLSLGIVGYGHVGSTVAQLARRLGMSVLAYDPYVADEVISAAGDTPVSFEVLLREATCVTLHARGGPGDAPLLGEREFNVMRDGAIVINTARESLVDEQALIDALDQGKIAGAALDVIHFDAANGIHPLIEHDRALVTPHIGGATHETLERGVDMIAREIERFAAGEPPLNAVAVKAR